MAHFRQAEGVTDSEHLGVIVFPVKKIRQDEGKMLILLKLPPAQTL
jgi:hypothetical protein